jgi:hypothetical protein
LIVSQLLEHLALELRFTLAEHELHEAPDAVAVLREGVRLVEDGGGKIPYVARAVVDAYLRSRN